jgi:hypothetical protein
VTASTRAAPGVALARPGLEGRLDRLDEAEARGGAERVRALERVGRRRADAAHHGRARDLRRLGPDPVERLQELHAPELLAGGVAVELAPGAVEHGRQPARARGRLRAEAAEEPHGRLAPAGVVDERRQDLDEGARAPVEARAQPAPAHARERLEDVEAVDLEVARDDRARERERDARLLLGAARERDRHDEVARRVADDRGPPRDPRLGRARAREREGARHAQLGGRAPRARARARRPRAGCRAARAAPTRPRAPRAWRARPGRARSPARAGGAPRA